MNKIGKNVIPFVENRFFKNEEGYITLPHPQLGSEIYLSGELKTIFNLISKNTHHSADELYQKFKHTNNTNEDEFYSALKQFLLLKIINVKTKSEWF